MSSFVIHVLVFVGLMKAGFGFEEEKARYLNFNGFEVRIPVSAILAKDAVRSILREEAAGIVLPDPPVISLSFGNIVDTSLISSEHLPTNAALSYRILRVTLPNLHRQSDDRIFTLPIREFFDQPKEFYEPFFNENVPAVSADSATFNGKDFHMEMSGESFDAKVSLPRRCVTTEAEIEERDRYLLQDEILVESGTFKPKACNIPDFCEDITPLIGYTVHYNVFITRKAAKTQKLCRAYVKLEVSDAFKHFTLLEDVNLSLAFPALYTKSPFWVGFISDEQ